MNDKVKIPADWEWGTLVDVVTGKQYSITGGPFGSDLQTKDYTIEGVQIIQLQNIGDGEFINDSKVYTSEEKANRLKSCNIFPNDIILAKMAEPVARACIIPNINKRFLMASDGIRVDVDKNKHNVRYIVAAINYEIFRRQAINKSTGTTRARIGLTDLKTIKFPMPSFFVQNKIARILTTVDNIIEKTESAIEKYKAIKQGMMHYLFTRGIDVKTGKLRPCFEDAPELYKETVFGMIPKEWKIVNISDKSSFVTNGFVGVATPFYTNKDNGVRYLYGTNIRANEFDLRDIRYVTKEFHIKQLKSNLQSGDMLTVQSGHIGTSAIVPEDFGEANCHALIITRFNSADIIPNYICYYLNSEIGMSQMEKLFIGSTIKHINTSDLAKHLVIMPNKDEQDLAVDKINTIQKLLLNENRLLSKTMKLKQGLMQDLLTGKKEVTPDPEDFNRE